MWEVQLTDRALGTVNGEQGSGRGTACGVQQTFVPLDSPVEHLPLALHLEHEGSQTALEQACLRAAEPGDTAEPAHSLLQKHLGQYH